LRSPVLRLIEFSINRLWISDVSSKSSPGRSRHSHSGYPGSHVSGKEMSAAPPAAASSISSTPRWSVFWRWRVTGGCWTTATRCGVGRLGMAHRVVPGPSEHPRQLFAQLSPQPARSLDQRVEVDPRLNTQAAEQ